MKDNFSSKSNEYLKYRPTYPPELYSYIDSIIVNKSAVWDCGTGNGQVAMELSRIFEKVYATDISQSQLEQAPKQKNIEYSVQRAEKTNFCNDLFDLIVVAQAIHWFDFEKFYMEVNRTGKPNSYIVVIGYGLHRINPDIDKVILEFYKNIIGNYWDIERKYLDENYQTIPFPFHEMEVPLFKNSYNWSFEHLIGYLRTWSSVKHYIKAKQQDPVDLIENRIKELWGEESTLAVDFPLLLRIGKVKPI